MDNLTDRGKIQNFKGQLSELRKQLESLTLENNKLKEEIANARQSFNEIANYYCQKGLIQEGTYYIVPLVREVTEELLAHISSLTKKIPVVQSIDLKIADETQVVEPPPPAEKSDNVIPITKKKEKPNKDLIKIAEQECKEFQEEMTSHAKPKKGKKAKK